MRTYLIAVVTFLVLAPVQSMAVEPINETHAMIYYKIPFSGAKKPENRPSFGFRMDHTSYQRGEMIEYKDLMNKTAAFDFRMGSEGVQGVYVSGVDFLQRYRLHRQAEGDAGEMEESMEKAEDKEPGTLTKVGTDIGNTIEDFAAVVPLGFMIGGAIALVLVTGVGG